MMRDGPNVRACGVVWLGGDSSLLEAAWPRLEIYHVLDARMALRALQHGVASCLVVDLALPDLDAARTLTTIRQRWPHVGVLALADVSVESAITDPPYPEVDCTLSRYTNFPAFEALICDLIDEIESRPKDSDFERVQERARRLERLALGTVAISEAPEFEGILSSLRTVGRVTVDADDVAILIADDDYGDLSDALNLGVPGDYLEVCREHLRSFPEEARPAYIGDEVLLRDRELELSSSPIRVREAEAAGAHSYIRVPITSADRIMGFVAMFSHYPNRFDGTHLQLGRLFAAQMATVVRNMRLYLRLTHAEQRQNAVNAVAQLIAEDLALDTVLQQIVQEATRLVLGDRGLVVLLQPDGSMVVSAVYNLPDSLVGRHAPPGVGQVGQIAHTRQPGVVLDYHHWTQANPDLLSTFPPDSILFGIPLTYRGSVLGVLQVLRSRNTPGDLNEVLDVLMMFAPQAAVAIAKAQLHEAIRQEERRLRTILTRIPAGIVVCDAAGHVQLINPEAERLLDLLGLGLPDVLDRHVIAIAQDVIPDLAGGLERVKNVLEVSLGKAGEYLVHIAPITDAEGYINGYVGVAQDVSDLRHMDRMKANLHRVLTHDLGNLIMLARSPLQMLDEDDLTLEQRDSLKSMLSGSLERMEALIRDVMDLEMADELGHSTMAPYHLPALVQQAVRRNQAQANNRQIQLEYQELEKLPESLKGHAVLIMQTIDNLVSNAVKYTPPGGRVDVTTTIEGDFAVIRVKDTGYGIPANKLDAIFEPFVRVRDSRTIHTPGTGLGLSLVKAFVEAHGGRVTVTSEVDVGSEFTVYLPLTPTTPAVPGGNSIPRLDLAAVIESRRQPQ